MHIPFFAKSKKRSVTSIAPNLQLMNLATDAAEKSPIEVLDIRDLTVVAGGPQITNNPPS